jgi:epoxyqueuosine reductase
MSEEEFREIFRHSPVKRTKWRGLVRNACVAIGNSGLRPGQPGYAKIAARLSELAASGDAILAEHAQWALERIGFAPETTSGS